jgi:galactitol-specific phosphotransferase system IIB component
VEVRVSDSLAVEVYYRMEGHSTLGGHEISFYQSLPGYKETHREERRKSDGSLTMTPAIPRPNIQTVLSVSGSAILSSTVLATAIKTWLQSRRSKITISQTKTTTTVTYEGPDLKDSVSDIKTVLEVMANKSPNQPLEIKAEVVPLGGARGIADLGEANCFRVKRRLQRL